MVKFPSTPSPKNVTELFEKIQAIGVPKTKVNFGYLKSLGFKSSYDGYLVGVLKSMGFINADGSASNMWQAYGVKKQRGSVMASAIKNTYSGLFATYQNAHGESDSTLLDYFKEKTGASDKDAGRMVETFRNLCAFADFEAALAVAPVPEPFPREEAARIPTVTPGLTVNINVQLTLPATDDESVYDKLFSSLKNNLLS